jgi:hypothetical protein
MYRSEPLIADAANAPCCKNALSVEAPSRGNVRSSDGAVPPAGPGHDGSARPTDSRQRGHNPAGAWSDRLLLHFGQTFVEPAAEFDTLMNA